MGFNQFMLLDSAADYAVKHTEQSEGLGSINFRVWQLTWNMMALKLVFSFLNLCRPQMEGLWHYVYLSCISLSRYFVREESPQVGKL